MPGEGGGAPLHRLTDSVAAELEAMAARILPSDDSLAFRAAEHIAAAARRGEI